MNGSFEQYAKVKAPVLATAMGAPHEFTKPAAGQNAVRPTVAPTKREISWLDKFAGLFRNREQAASESVVESSAAAAEPEAKDVHSMKFSPLVMHWVAEEGRIHAEWNSAGADSGANQPRGGQNVLGPLHLIFAKVGGLAGAMLKRFRSIGDRG